MRSKGKTRERKEELNDEEEKADVKEEVRRIAENRRGKRGRNQKEKEER